MAEEAQGASGGERQFIIRKLYTKDVSFETNNTPAIFTQKWEPDIKLQINSNHELLEENLYEVVLSITVTANHGNDSIYLAEVHQAGIFQVAGFTEEELGPLLGSYCPTQLYPFVREVVAHLVGNGGFPPLVLTPINFEGLYHHRLQAQREQQEGQGEQAPMN